MTSPPPCPAPRMYLEEEQDKEDEDRDESDDSDGFPGFGRDKEIPVIRKTSREIKMTRPSERSALRLFSRENTEDYEDDEDTVDGPPGFCFEQATLALANLTMEANFATPTKVKTASSSARTALRLFLKKVAEDTDTEDEDEDKDNTDGPLNAGRDQATMSAVGLNREEIQTMETKIKIMSSQRIFSKKDEQESEADKEEGDTKEEKTTGAVLQ